MGYSASPAPPQAEREGAAPSSSDKSGGMMGALQGKMPEKIFTSAIQGGDLWAKEPPGYREIGGRGSARLLMRPGAGKMDLREYAPASLTYPGSESLYRIPDTNWEIAGTGDFNDDGQVDILWRYYGTGGAQGYNVVWYMNGATNIGSVYLYAVTDTNWRIVGTGDFNGDGKTDILWRYYGTGGAQGYNVVWYMNGINCTTSDYIYALADTNWKIEATGDFNGDGKPDIVWRNYGTGWAQGYNVVWFMDGKTNTTSVYLDTVTDTAWRMGGTGDFNGDGKTDILWRYYGTGWAQGYNVLWYMNGATYAGYDYVYPVYDRYWAIVNR